MKLKRTSRAVLLAVALSGTSAQLKLDPASEDSITSNARSIVANMVDIYTTFVKNPTYGIPGLLPEPYYWWEAGAMFGALIDYWYHTGDDAYNDLVIQGLQFQVGEDTAFMPPNQTKNEVES